jgi:hypothetical protein
LFVLAFLTFIRPYMASKNFDQFADVRYTSDRDYIGRDCVTGVTRLPFRDTARKTFRVLPDENWSILKTDPLATDELPSSIYPNRGACAGLSNPFSLPSMAYLIFG